ncbi:MAG: GIY-YIG nuclease family protein [Legionellales bacterium]|nr:GIY-YIG nuclease family protein [Legionellales bacterium]
MEIVYIFTNKNIPDIIKNGSTDNISRRVRELDSASTPLPFEYFSALEVKMLISLRNFFTKHLILRERKKEE